MNVRQRDFLAVIDRDFHYFPRSAVRAWALEQFELVAKGGRNAREVSDEALGAWIRTAPPRLQEREARELWGRGWARGVEVDARK